MAAEIIAIFIPIIGILVLGLVLITYYYFRSRERQMLIEKGLSAEDIKKFFEQKKDYFRMMKIGIVAVAFGFGLGLGMLLEDKTSKDYWVPFALFVFTGVGFIIANLLTNKLDAEKNINQNN